MKAGAGHSLSDPALLFQLVEDVEREVVHVLDLGLVAGFLKDLELLRKKNENDISMSLCYSRHLRKLALECSYSKPFAAEK